MRKSTRNVLGFVAVVTALKAVALMIARAFERDRTASADDFKILAVMDGREVRSEATSLRTGSATAVWGGIEIDLRNASLDPGGAHLALKAVMGGMRITVPDDWRVDVEVDAKAGGVEVETPDPSAAEDRAPRLFVEAYARMGGILIRPAKSSRRPLGA